MKHRLNQIVTMSDEAIEDNYGEKYRDRKYEIVHIATHSIRPELFYAQNMPQGYHPGYDEGVYPTQLYDLVDVETGESLNFSLYEWEIK